MILLYRIRKKIPFSCGFWVVLQNHRIIEIMIEDLLKQAEDKIGKEQCAEAIELLTKALEQDNNHLMVLQKRAECYHKLNQWTKALNDYNRYLRLNPENEELKAHRDLVQIIIKNGQLDIYACTNTHLDPWN